jgi:methylated-DNA-[protein]-cysteine S-methyltransferase
MAGLTEFRRHVFLLLARVPWAGLTTYGRLARALDRPGAARAAGQACAANPMPILLPCHRVVAADGRLGGFSSGLAWKRCLLRHEGWVVEGDRVELRRTPREGPGMLDEMDLQRARESGPQR